MKFENKHGKFLLIKDYREGFDEEAFTEKYIPELFEKFQFFVGDVSAGILRLKGFYEDTNKKNNHKKIPDYLNEYCNMNTAYYIVQKL